MIRKIPLTNLHAAWSPGSVPGAPRGLEFDCPVCPIAHRLAVGLHDQASWPTPLYRYAGGTLADISLAPRVDGRLHHGTCAFRGWVKCGHVEIMHLESRKVTRWVNESFQRE